MARNIKQEEARNTARIRKIAIIAVIGLLVVLVLSYIIGFKAHFLLAEELIIRNEGDSYLVAVNNEPIPITVATSIDTHFACQSSCTFKLTDLYTNEILYEYTDVDVTQTHTVDLPITIQSQTNGTRLYEYFVSCNNKRTTLCSATNTTYRKAQLITVDHVQSPAQEELSAQLTTMLTNMRQDVVLLQGIHNDYHTTATKLSPSTTRKQVLNMSVYIADTLLAIQDTLTTTVDVLLNGNLDAVQEQLTTIDVVSVEQTITTFIKEVSFAVAKFNELQELKQSLQTELSPYYVAAYSSVGSNIAISSYNTFLAAEDNVTYTMRIQDLRDARTILNTTRNNYTQAKNDDLVELTTYLDSVASLYGTSKNTSCDQVKQTTSILNSLERQHARQRNVLGNDTTVNTSTITDFFDELSSIQQQYFLGTNLSLQQNYSFSTAQYTTQTPIDVLAALFTLNTSLLETFSDSYCIDAPEHILPTYDPITITQSNQSSLEYTYVFKEQCCFAGECRVCSEVDDTKRPILLLHGHSFNSALHPETTFVSFSDMQLQLAKDGYINAGEIDRYVSYDDELAGVWGRFSEPIVVRGSYYFVNYYDLGNQVVASQKHESIESYAIRLKEIVDYIQQRTGAPQIDIVAHSMGGLVARQYISLFGESDVHTLIMIGTPNYGIRGSIDTFCAVTGAKKECEEMQENSIFLKRLNDPRFAPQKTTFVTVTARGCPMQGVDGDGVVLSSNVPLPYAQNYFIDGNCTGFLGTDYHRNLIKPQHYPEIYDIVLNYTLGTPS